MQLKLSKDELIELWEQGICSPTFYVYLALKMEVFTQGKLDIDGFIHRWRGVLNPDNGKVKTLSVKQVRAALDVMEEKGILNQENAVQLEFIL